MFCFSDSEYKANKDLRVYVIEPALKEIHEQTDLSITDTQFLKKDARSIRFTSQPNQNSLKKRQKIAILAILSKNCRNPYEHRKTV